METLWTAFMAWIGWHLAPPVFVDHDQSMCFTVTAFTFRQSSGPSIELSWVHNGDIKSAWVEEFRLTSATR